MNNATCGNTMEDVRSHMDFELVDNIEGVEKCSKYPTMKNRHCINDTLVVIRQKRL